MAAQIVPNPLAKGLRRVYAPRFQLPGRVRRHLGNLSPGETQSRANRTNNRWYYYYAEADDAPVWAGPYVAEVTQDRFEKRTCFGVIVQNGPATNPYREVGFRE